jgi:hypothetical protein
MPSHLFASKASGIELISLPSKCLHAMQPSDVGRFAVVKKHFRKTLQLVLDRRPGQQPPKTQLATLVSNAAVETATRQSIQNAFRATGIWPIDETVYSKQLGPSLLFTEGGGEANGAVESDGEGGPTESDSEGDSDEECADGGLETFQAPPFAEAWDDGGWGEEEAVRGQQGGERGEGAWGWQAEEEAPGGPGSEE